MPRSQCSQELSHHPRIRVPHTAILDIEQGPGCGTRATERVAPKPDQDLGAVCLAAIEFQGCGFFYQAEQVLSRGQGSG
jgi:hypothetical protein